MRVLLTGASGFVGRHVACALTAGGHGVVPVSRRHGLDMGRLTRAQDWRPLLAGVDAVINAAGIIGQTRGQSFRALHTDAPIALFEACAEAGVRRVVQISALGADDSAFSAFHLSKRAADRALGRLDLDAFVLRPSFIYGPGGVSAALFLRLARLPRIPVVDRGQQLIQPVHIDDVVDVILRCLCAGGAGLTLDIVGPRSWSFAAWLQHLRTAQGLPPAPLVRVPYALARVLAALAHVVSPLMRQDNLRMLARGHLGEAGDFVRFMGRPAREATPARLLGTPTPIRSLA